MVAYALAGTVTLDLATEPLGTGHDGSPVFLADIWPSRAEIDAAMSFVTPAMFRARYADVFTGDAAWQALPVAGGERYAWEPDSTYLREPPFFKDMALDVAEPGNILDARVLALLGDSITTDHISPAGAIPRTSPAADHLRGHGVADADFNSYGSRRGNHRVMLRGTFGNVRLRNQLAPGTEGGLTRHLPTGEVLPIHDAAMRYREAGTPLIILAGKEYGTGSSRDWAAKGTLLLGVKAVFAQSFERIHRGNLVAMGVLPLEFAPGENAATLGLTGEETFHISGIAEDLTPAQTTDHLRRAARWGRSALHRHRPASIPPSRWTTTNTAAFCHTSSAKCCKRDEDFALPRDQGWLALDLGSVTRRCNPFRRKRGEDRLKCVPPMGLCRVAYNFIWGDGIPHVETR